MSCGTSTSWKCHNSCCGPSRAIQDSQESVKALTRWNADQSSRASASLTSDRSYQTAISNALKIANRGQAGASLSEEKCRQADARPPPSRAVLKDHPETKPLKPAVCKYKRFLISTTTGHCSLHTRYGLEFALTKVNQCRSFGSPTVLR